MGRAHSGSLLERDELLARLGESVDAAGAGAGSLVLIAGEAGAGKTSLLRAARDFLAGTADLWLGHCDPLSTPRPLSPLLDIAAQPDAGLDDLIGDGEQPYDLFARFLARLRDAPRPVMVAIEDAHWADDATLDLLRFLGRRVATVRAVVAVTYRDDEVGPEHPLRAVIGELVSQPATADVVRRVVENNAVDGVTWIHSYVSDDRVRTFCVYDGPTPEAIRAVATRNGLPIDAITAVSVLDPYFYRSGRDDG